ncbi:MAG: Spy/CpxP family protein refolding chaperone [SAR324 cluster bacterium]|nr:Spy/CpxP family protein refolding chaperone [SAR324 cluster bacterium]
MKRIMIIGLILLSTLALASCGMHRFGHHGNPSKHMADKIACELDLTDAQEAELDGIFTEWDTKRMSNQSEHIAHMDALIAEVQKDEINKSVVDTIHKAKSAKMDERSEFFATKLIAFHKTLTAEQKTKLAEVLGEWKEKHNKRGGM